MSVTFPLQFPDVGITKFDLRYRKTVAMTESPFSYAQQIHDFGGGRWEAEVTLAPLTYEQSKPVQAFLIGLEGRKGTFEMAHPLHTTTMSATLATGSAGDEDISFNQQVTAGTYFSIADRLYMTTETGTSSVNIQPPLRADASSASVDFTQPKGTWRMATNEANIYTDTNGLFYITFACVEAL